MENQHDEKHQQKQPGTQLEKDSGQGLVVSQKIESVAKCVFDLNMIKEFPLSVMEIEDWSATVIRIYPDLDEGIMRKVIDNFLTGEWYFDKEIGIRNIFDGIKQIQSGLPANHPGL